MSGYEINDLIRDSDIDEPRNALMLRNDIPSLFEDFSIYFRQEDPEKHIYTIDFHHRDRREGMYVISSY